MSGAAGSRGAPSISKTVNLNEGDDGKEPKPAAAFEEDDEFEDFPVENWGPEETEAPTNNAHLWEESWDDDDTTEDFSAQLNEEIKKVEANKKSS